MHEVNSIELRGERDGIPVVLFAVVKGSDVKGCGGFIRREAVGIVVLDPLLHQIEIAIFPAGSYVIGCVANMQQGIRQKAAPLPVCDVADAHLKQFLIGNHLSPRRIHEQDAPPKDVCSATIRLEQQTGFNAVAAKTQPRHFPKSP